VEWLGLRNSGQKILRLLSSPELNPCHYYFWGFLERGTNCVSQQNFNDLKAINSEKNEGKGQGNSKKVCKRFRPLMNHVIENNAGYFE
jgi:hypothetical protein